MPVSGLQNTRVGRSGASLLILRLHRIFSVIKQGNRPDIVIKYLLLKLIFRIFSNYSIDF